MVAAAGIGEVDRVDELGGLSIVNGTTTRSQHSL